MNVAPAGEQVAKVAFLFVAVAAFNNFRRGGSTGLVEWVGAKFMNTAALRPGSVDGAISSRTSSPSSSSSSADGSGLANAALDQLVQVGSTKMSARFAARWVPLVAAAKRDGIILEGSAYRTAGRQIELRREHCGTSHYDIYDKPPSQCHPPTAKPGSSKHETGDAIDVASGGASITRSSAEFKWLAKNAGRFGVFNLPSEAWHWSIDGK